MNTTQAVVKKLVDEQFDGNYNKCAKNLDVAPSTIGRIANGTGGAGIKVITNIIKYCNEKNINYDRYIFFKFMCCSERT